MELATELAKRLGYHKESSRYWILKGWLKTTKLGHVHIVMPQDAESFEKRLKGGELFELPKPNPNKPGEYLCKQCGGSFVPTQRGGMPQLFCKPSCRRISWIAINPDRVRTHKRKHGEIYNAHRSKIIREYRSIPCHELISITDISVASGLSCVTVAFKLAKAKMAPDWKWEKGAFGHTVFLYSKDKLPIIIDVLRH